MAERDSHEESCNEIAEQLKTLLGVPEAKAKPQTPFEQLLKANPSVRSDKERGNFSGKEGHRKSNRGTLSQQKAPGKIKAKKNENIHQEDGYSSSSLPSIQAKIFSDSSMNSHRHIIKAKRRLNHAENKSPVLNLHDKILSNFDKNNKATKKSTGDESERSCKKTDQGVNEQEIKLKGGCTKSKESRKSQGNQEDHATYSFLKELEKNFIFPLKKKSPKFPRALFFCRLCSYHCDSERISEDHTKSGKHKHLMKIKKGDILLGSLPNPTDAHICALSKLLEKTYEDQVLSKFEIQQRQSTLKLVKDLLAHDFPDVNPQIYGSTITGFALKGSDLNIDLSGANGPQALAYIYQKLKDDNSGCLNVRSDFSAKVPCVYFVVKGTATQVQLTINSGSGVQTSKLLATYAKINPTICKLVVAFRYLAKICLIDDQKRGTLPSYVFALLTIYFLQQRKHPMLPILHQIGKRKEDEDDYESNLEKVNQEYKSTWDTSLGQLWFEMLRFYAVELDMSLVVISIRQKKIISRSEKRWSSKRILIEDPFSRKRNVARAISHADVCDYIYDKLRNAFKYFTIPQTKNGPAFSEIDNHVLDNLLQKSLVGDIDRTKNNSSPTVIESTKKETEGKAALPDIECNSPEIDNGVFQLESVVNALNEINPSQNTENLSSPELKPFNSLKNDVCNDSGPSLNLETPPSHKQLPVDHSAGVHTAQVWVYDQKVIDSLVEHDFKFTFQDDSIVDKTGPAVFCSLCGVKGHLKSHCPDEILPQLDPLPPLTTEYNAMLSRLLHEVPAVCEASEDEKLRRNQILNELELFIRRYDIFKDAELQLFGSSCNGFGFAQSDLDICMTLRSMEEEDNKDLTFIIECLAFKLKRNPKLKEVVAISTAKVPIVKFVHIQSGLEGDISLYNILAQKNTAMLKLYSEIDTRVKVLGYTMKKFAKVCNIGDASKGSLSSYAYILMVIHFLQQRSPPVLPVLQELYSGEKPVMLVEGWNAWFFDKKEELGKVCPEIGRNRESLAELWIGLLRYYTEDFNFKDFVVCTRQLKPLTRFDKLWTGKGLAIEDPFNLGHNLGVGVSRKMNIYIMKALRNGRSVFGTPGKIIQNRQSTIEEILFNQRLLTDGEPPNDRGCRACGKIGHFVKDCPNARRNSDRAQRQHPRHTPHPKRQQQQHKQDWKLQSDEHDTPAARGPKTHPAGRNDMAARAVDQIWRNSRRYDADKRTRGRKSTPPHALHTPSPTSTTHVVSSPSTSESRPSGRGNQQSRKSYDTSSKSYDTSSKSYDTSSKSYDTSNEFLLDRQQSALARVVHRVSSTASHQPRQSSSKLAGSPVHGLLSNTSKSNSRSAKQNRHKSKRNPNQ